MREFKAVLCKFIYPVQLNYTKERECINNALERKEERPWASSGCQNKIVTCPLKKDQPIPTLSNYNHTELNHHKSYGLHTFLYSVSKNQVKNLSATGKRSWYLKNK